MKRLALFIVVCNGVHHAHQKGIIHRDIKPTNVLVAEYDNHPVPKIIDFGVAKAVDHRLTEKTMFTEYGQLVGTVEYMSPEQAKLNQLDIDTRSDVYSLGVLLYELLTGETPFDRARLASVAYDELLRIIRDEEPPRPSMRLSASNSLPTIAAKRHVEPNKLRTLVCGELDWIVMKALEKERGRRYESSHSLATDVERFLIGQPVEAHPPSMAYRVRKFVRRYRASVGTALALLAMLVLGGIGTTTGWLRVRAINTVLERKNRETELAWEAAQKGKELAEQESALRRWQLYLADMRLAGQAWENGNLGQLEMLLRRHVPRGDELDLRGFEWRYFWRNLRYESKVDEVVQTHGREFWAWLALSSDGSRLAIGCPGGPAAVKIVNLGTHKVEASFGRPSGFWTETGLAMSRDGQTVIYRGPSQRRQQTEGSTASQDIGRVIVRMLKTGEERFLETETARPAIALSPDQRTLAVAYSETTVWLWDLETWKRVGTLEGLQGCAHALAFSPDGTSLAAGDEANVHVWNTTTGQLAWRGMGNSSGILAVAYSPQGKFLVTGSYDSLVVIWDAASGQRLHTLVARSGEVRAVAFSPDGDMLAAGCREGVIRLWRLPDFREHEVIRGFSGVYSLAFLPDRRLLFATEVGRIVVRDVPQAGYHILSVGEVRGGMRNAVFTGDGRTLLAIDGGASPVVHRWKVTDEGCQPMQPLTLECGASAIAVSCHNLLAVGDAMSSAVLVYDLVTEQRQDRLEVPDVPGVTCLAFSADGTWLAVGCLNGRVIVWDVDKSRVVFNQAAHNGKAKDLCFCDSSDMLLTVGLDGSTKLWDVRQQTTTRVFEKVPSTLMSVAAAKDGRSLATGTFADDTHIRLYDRTSDRPFALLSGHTSAVRGLRFFENDKTLVSAGGDRTLRLWDVKTREERYAFDGGTCIFEFIAVSPDERTLVAGGRDGTIRLFRAATPAEVQSTPDWWRLPDERVSQ